MSEVLTPDLRTYSLTENRIGVIAGFPGDTGEYIKAENFGDILGINWTTDLGAEQIPEQVNPLLPAPAEVEAWGETSGKIVLGREIIPETFRLTYCIEPNQLCKDGLVIVWRQINGSKPPYQIGALVSIDQIEIPRSLIESTATGAVKARRDILDFLLEKIQFTK